MTPILPRLGWHYIVKISAITERQTQSSEELRHLDSGGGGVAGGQSEADDDSAADHAELRAEYERLLKTQSTGNITEQTAHHSNRLHGMCV